MDNSKKEPNLVSNGETNESNNEQNIISNEVMSKLNVQSSFAKVPYVDDEFLTDTSDSSTSELDTSDFDL
eukprot:TRINITY_DN4950_c0_g1_i1.p1 TRINITY_DN4950_c0_g1~~TRINITY_DN4950_c0_g1_i1.p1  ORF type:complete len:70 (+),score=24.61 TRINITY_DN4950_c0_g1_i1:64-273(+)